jgi:hypothetical protein
MMYQGKVQSWRRKGRMLMTVLTSQMVLRMVRWWVMLWVVLTVLGWRRKDKIGMIS